MSLKESDYLLALSRVYGLGGVILRNLIGLFDSAEQICQADISDLVRVPKVTRKMADQIAGLDVAELTKSIRAVCEQRGYQVIAINEPAYPQLLSHCPDAPMVIFFKGGMDLNKGPFISMVGTRRMSTYGRRVISKIVEELAPWDPVFVSGLAYGVDITVHRKALEMGMRTLAILPGGLDQVYPQAHIHEVRKMLEKGGILSEMPPGILPEREFFPIRNRIIAGLSDGTVVVESGRTGGSIITAMLAQGYNRDVLAVPGSIFDPGSDGPNRLIKEQIAHPVVSGEELAQILRWGEPDGEQLRLFDDLDPEEQEIVNAVRDSGSCHVDELVIKFSTSPAQISGLLLSLECKGVLRVLPGDRVSLS